MRLTATKGWSYAENLILNLRQGWFSFIKVQETRMYFKELSPEKSREMTTMEKKRQGTAE